MKENKTLYELAVERMEAKDIDHWCNDLYLRKNEISTELLNNYEFKKQVTVFKDNIDHVDWYEIPFAAPFRI